MHVVVIVLLYTIHIHKHNSRSNPIAFFLYLPKEKKKKKLQYVSTETILRVTQSLLLLLRILKICFQQKSLHHLTYTIVQTVNNAVHNACYCQKG